MPAKYKLSLLAENDMENIFDYTIDRWGEPQAAKYTRQLYDHFQCLADNQQLGIWRNDVKDGYRSWIEGSHTIFYCVTDGNIGIIGVPHQSMDVEQHLSIEKSSEENL